MTDGQARRYSCAQSQQLSHPMPAVHARTWRLLAAADVTSVTSHPHLKTLRPISRSRQPDRTTAFYNHPPCCGYMTSVSFSPLFSYIFSCSCATVQADYIINLIPSIVSYMSPSPVHIPCVCGRSSHWPVWRRFIQPSSYDGRHSGTPSCCQYWEDSGRGLYVSI